MWWWFNASKGSKRSRKALTTYSESGLGKEWPFFVGLLRHMSVCGKLETKCPLLKIFRKMSEFWKIYQFLYILYHIINVYYYTTYIYIYIYFRKDTYLEKKKKRESNCVSQTLDCVILGKNVWATFINSISEM